jgi:hypothetical protein
MDKMPLYNKQKDSDMFVKFKSGIRMFIAS